jgi:hypothetical protein
MVGEPPFDELPHFLGHRIRRERGRHWRRGLPGPGPPVRHVEAELAALGLVLPHQEAARPPHVAVEGIHSPGGAARLAGAELFYRREPTLVGDDLEAARLYQRLEIYPQLALCRFHDTERTDLTDQGFENGVVGTRGDDVADGHAPCGLLQREVTKVG